jgi:ferrochelatase
LFPQYSNTTTLSVINEWVRYGKKLIAPIIIQRFHQHPKYIEACKERIIEKLDQDSGKPYLLFSAHSIPQIRIKQGDPYQVEIEETVELILEEFHGYGHSLCYQSKVGPAKWLEPNIKDELKGLKNRGLKNLLVCPVGFVSEHLETLHELDIKYRKVAEDLGFNQFIRANTVQAHPLFIDCLKELVLENCQ